MPQLTKLELADRSLPPELIDVALIDGATAARACGLSMSQWYSLVSTGDAPQPVIRRPRCSRWRVTDLRSWLHDAAARGSFERREGGA